MAGTLVERWRCIIAIATICDLTSHEGAVAGVAAREEEHVRIIPKGRVEYALTEQAERRVREAHVSVVQRLSIALQIVRNFTTDVVSPVKEPQT